MTSVAERSAATPATDSAFRRPGPGDSLLIVVALSAVSTSGPLVAAASVAGLAIAFWRNAMASALLLPLAAARHRGDLKAVARGKNPAALLAGLLLALHFGTWIPSIGMTTVASATALVATQPVWSALLAKAAGEHIARGAWAGIGVAVLGAALVTGVDVTVSTRALEGDLLAIVGGAFAAAYVQAGSAARRTLTTTSYTAVCYSITSVLLLGACLLSGERLGGYSSRNWLLLLGLTVGPQLLGHSVMNRVLKTTSPAVMSLCILFEVPGAALLAYVWLGQQPSLLALPGMALLIVGVALVVRASSRVLAVAETD